MPVGKAGPEPGQVLHKAVERQGEPGKHRPEHRSADRAREAAAEGSLKRRIAKRRLRGLRRPTARKGIPVRHREIVPETAWLGAVSGHFAEIGIGAELEERYDQPDWPGGIALSPHR